MRAGSPGRLRDLTARNSETPLHAYHIRAGTLSKSNAQLPDSTQPAHIGKKPDSVRSARSHWPTRADRRPRVSVRYSSPMRTCHQERSWARCSPVAAPPASIPSQPPHSTRRAHATRCRERHARRRPRESVRWVLGARGHASACSGRPIHRLGVSGRAGDRALGPQGQVTLVDLAGHKDNRTNGECARK